MLRHGDQQLLALDDPVLNEFLSVLGRECSVVRDAGRRNKHIADDVLDLFLKCLKTTFGHSLLGAKVVYVYILTIVLFIYL